MLPRPVWLQQVGGARADNVLAYFERSPFYETGEGLEFALERSRNPRCLSISKRRKKATGDGFDVEAYFYVLDGTIYQCPTIDALATSRLRKAGNYLTKAFGEMRAECDRLDEARRAFVEAPALASEKTPAPRSRAELEGRGWLNPPRDDEDPKLRRLLSSLPDAAGQDEDEQGGSKRVAPPTAPPNRKLREVNLAYYCGYAIPGWTGGG